MKVVYFANFENPYSDTTEKHITKALEELGHTVLQFNEKDFFHDKNRMIEHIYYGADLFLFHKGGLRAGVKPAEFVDFLNYVVCKKTMWFFDKISDQFAEALPQGNVPRELFIDAIAPFIDKGFVTDETFLKRRKYDNLEVLRQGVSPATGEPQYKEKYAVDVAYVGAIYGKRKEFVEGLGKYNFKVFNNVFGKNLKDLCYSAKIVVAPKFPSDDFYWSSRIYQILGNGGFLIHPRLHGLKEEFEEGKHYVGYKGMEDLCNKIDYYLEHQEEREKIKGEKYCLENYTYKDRVKELLEK